MTVASPSNTSESLALSEPRPARRPSLATRYARLVTPVLVFAVAAWLLLGQAARVGYNTDEGQFISTAQYFDIVFRDGQLGGAPWDETYWTLTQPPVTRYILGAAIRLSGNPVPPVDLEHRGEEARGPNRERFLDPAYYRDERRLAEARRVDRPSPAVLQAGRIPMALFGAGAAVLLFLVARTLSGLVGGLVAAAGLLAAPLALQLLPRAHAEGPLVFFTLLGLYLGVRAARATGGSRSVLSRSASHGHADLPCHSERSEESRSSTPGTEVLRCSENSHHAGADHRFASPVRPAGAWRTALRMTVRAHS